MPARAMPPRRMKNTPATLSMLSSEVSSAEGLDKSGQDLLGHHLFKKIVKWNASKSDKDLIILIFDDILENERKFQCHKWYI